MTVSLSLTIWVRYCSSICVPFFNEITISHSIISADIKKTVVDALPATNTLIPPLLIALDDDESVFPHDRVVPQEMVNFRVNGKFKNKPPPNSAVSPVSEDSTENSQPKIEVSGQLPPDTYDLRLKASPNGQPMPPVQIPDVIRTDDEINYTSVEPNFPGFDEEEEQPTILTGIGVAEPVLDTELGRGVKP